MSILTPIYKKKDSTGSLDASSRKKVRLYGDSVVYRSVNKSVITRVTLESIKMHFCAVQLIIYSSMYLVNKDQKDVFDAAKRDALNIWACIYVYMQKSISTTDMPEYSPKKRDKMSRVSLLFSRQGTENLCNYKTLNTSNRSSHFHATM